MDTLSDNMRARLAASTSAPIATDFDYKRAFQDLESLVYRVQTATRLASYLAREDMGFAKDGAFTVHEEQGDFIQFAASVAEDYADRLHDQWLDAHNESTRAEWAALGFPADQVPA